MLHYIFATFQNTAQHTQRRYCILLTFDYAYFKKIKTESISLMEILNIIVNIFDLKNRPTTCTHAVEPTMIKTIWQLFQFSCPINIYSFYDRLICENKQTKPNMEPWPNCCYKSSKFKYQHPFQMAENCKWKIAITFLFNQFNQ